MTRLRSPLRHALWAGFLVASGTSAQEAGPLLRFTVAVGGTRLGFPDVYVPSTSAATGSVRLRLMQREGVSAVATAQLVMPFTVIETTPGCLPNTACRGTSSPGILVGGSVGLGRIVSDKLMIAAHLGAVRAVAMEGGGPKTRATLAADLSWKLVSRPVAPVIGLTAVSFLGNLAGGRGYLTPTLGFTW